MFSLVVLAGCHSPKPPSMRGHVELIAPKAFNFQEQATYQSTLESISNVAMAAEIDGRITSMPMQQGQQVQPGDLLFTLDQVQQRAQVDAAAAEARKTRVNADRYIFLNNQGAVSTKDRDYYVTQAIESADRLRADQATLDYKNVVAPIAGQVGSIQHKLGSVVNQGEIIVNIVDNSKLWVRLDVPSELAHRLRLGMPVALKAPGLPAELPKGEVSFIAPSLDRSSQTLLVKATFDNPNGVLRDQQRVAAVLSFGSNSLPSVPVGAVLLQAGQTFVFTAVPAAKAQKQLGRELKPKPAKGDLIAVQTQVGLGTLQDGRYPVLKGLDGSEKVVIGNLAQLRSGMVLPVTGQ